MNCLCCGKPLKIDNDYGRHKSCIKHFFDTETLPEIEFDNDTLNLLASETANQGFTVPGVQKKLSLHLMSDEKKPRLTLVNFPTGYILKPQVEEFKALPESEQLIMSMADKVGISTVPHALIKNKTGLAYITKRIDRIISKDNVSLLAMEDFCQLDLRLTEDKYRGSYERCAKIIEKYSSRTGIDITEFYIRIIFCFIIGNSDMHLKNFSLRETQPGNREFRLSRAYDILPVNVIMPEDKEQLALTLNGKKRNIRKKDFRVFAEACNIPDKAARHMIDRICSLKDKFICQVDESYLPQTEREELMDFINARIEILNS